MIDSLLEQKLVELFGDPDQGMILRDSMRKRLLRQKSAVEKGERGKSVGDYRILYQVLEEEKVILIHAVGHRREVYRKR